MLLLSAAPLPLWFYGITVVLVIAWLILFRFRGTTSLAKKRWASAIVAGVLLVGAAFELRYQFAPQVAPVTARRIYLFGDSLAAGINDHRENNWPQIVARSHNVEVVNYARPGAKTATALRLAQDASLMGGLVLIEIGGNDVLGSTTAEEFERSLNALLTRVSGPDRQVIMFELPLPPLHNAYGQVQRKLAAHSGVLLIPKHVLMGVIAGQDATLDSIHLTPSGHRHLAASVWQVLSPAF